MVNNKNVILDEGKLKYTREVKMSKQFVSLEKAVRNKCEEVYTIKVFDDNICDFTSEEIINDDCKPWPPKIAYYFKSTKALEMEEPKLMTTKRLQNRWKRFQLENLDLIREYLGIIPFVPSIMINISPDWKGKQCDKYARVKTIPLFKKVIETYLNTCKRYQKWKYCIESGSNDDFIHCHIVAQYNKDILKSVETHVRKGNHLQEIRKIWDKTMPQGKKGILKGKFAIQSTIIRTSEMEKDKLDYLQEENKPEGHTNKVDLGIIEEGSLSLITSKE